MLGKCVILGVMSDSIGGRSRSKAIGWTLEDCRPGQRSRSSVPQEASGVSKSPDGTAPRLTQLKPAQIEVFQTEEDIRELAAGYKTVQQSASGIDARAEIAYGENVVFRVQDRWSLNGAVVSVQQEGGSGGERSGWFQLVCRAYGRSFRTLGRRELPGSRCVVR